MSNQETSSCSSTNEEKLICPNCHSNLLRVDVRKQSRMINTVYSFNEDNFTCIACGKVNFHTTSFVGMTIL